MKPYIHRTNESRQSLLEAVARLRSITDSLVGSAVLDIAKSPEVASAKRPLLHELDVEISDLYSVIGHLHSEISRLHSALELGDGPAPSAKGPY